jgi:hypothetical protein
MTSDYLGVYRKVAYDGDRRLRLVPRVSERPVRTSAMLRPRA